MNAFVALGKSRETVGLLVGALMLCSWPVRVEMVVTPAWLLLAVVFLSSVAGFIVGGFAAGEGLQPSQAVRCGVWGAAIAGVVSASLFALVARSVPNPLFVLRAMLGGILSILPAMFYGMFAAGVAALTFARAPSPTPRQGAASTLPSPVVRGLWALIVLVAVLAVVSPLTPEPVAKPIAPLSIASIPAPAAPPFIYAVSAEMAMAHALQWKLSSTRLFQDVNGKLATLSQDGRWLACPAKDGQTVRVYDLHSPDTSKLIVLPRPIDRLSFNPSADRLFVTSGGGVAELAVIDLSTTHYIHLPKPRKGAMPSGRLLWWKEKEILIAADGGERLILNLDTLEIDGADSVPSWKGTAIELREKLIREIDGALRDTQRWQWKTDTLVQSTELPARGAANLLSMKRTTALSISHPERDSSVTFGSIPTEAVDRFLSSRDGSKVVLVSGDTIRVNYFEVTAAPVLKWTITMPSSPSECPDASAVEAALEAGTLSALIYPPMSNPLNQTVVGPVREVVKAVVKFQEWHDKTAVVYVSQRFAPLASGDVIADVVGAPDEHAELLSIQAPHRWWARLPEAAPGSEDITALPASEAKTKQLTTAREKRNDKRRAEEAGRKTREDAERKAKAGEDAGLVKIVVERMAKVGSDGRTNNGMERPDAIKPNTPEATKATPQPAPADAIEDRIRRFIVAHHQKHQQRDIDGLARDYASRVNYFTGGDTSREEIRDGLSSFHAANIVSEDVTSKDIRVTKLPGNRGYTASYILRVKIQPTNNGLAPTVFKADTNLTISEISGTLQINRHKITIQK